jgi:cytochrome P450
MRMASPTINLISRKATKDTELDGMVIPKGTRVTVDIAAIHYNDKVWENPQVFDPERFADGGEYESMPSKYLYLPFGGGSRQCIGSFHHPKCIMWPIIFTFHLIVRYEL